jgi:phosphoglycerate dehydrogenase-like enzyme
MEKFRVGMDEHIMRTDRTSVNPGFDVATLEKEADLEFFPIDCGGAVRAEHTENVDAMVLGGTRVNADSFHPNGRLTSMSRYGVGYDQIDPATCTAAGVVLTITPAGVRRPVAVSSLALMLAITTKLLIKDRLTREDRYSEREQHNGTGLVGRTLGSLGLGSIAGDFFGLAKPLDMRCIAHDPYTAPERAKELGVALVDIETLFRESDVLCVHSMLNDETRGIVSADRLALMKPTAYLVNTARGGLVDQPALTAALTEGRLAGAGLDVLAAEPPDPNDPILRLDNVILSPHATCSTDQCAHGISSLGNLAAIDVMHGREPTTVVNREILGSQAWRDKLQAYGARFGG